MDAACILCARVQITRWFPFWVPYLWYGSRFACNDLLRPRRRERRSLRALPQLRGLSISATAKRQTGVLIFCAHYVPARPRSRLSGWFGVSGGRLKFLPLPPPPAISLVSRPASPRSRSLSQPAPLRIYRSQRLTAGPPGWRGGLGRRAWRGQRCWRTEVPAVTGAPGAYVICALERDFEDGG